MTPIEIDILLHYYVSPEEYRNGDIGAPAVLDALKKFVSRGLIVKRTVPNEYGALYEGNSAALKVYVETLCAVPLPVQKWVMP